MLRPAPGIVLLAWRNLASERLRFAATLTGVAFAVVLMGAQLGLLLAFARAASTLIDHADADLWVTQAGTRSVDIAAALDLGRRHLALAVPGVVAADPYMVQFAFWRRPDGGTESVIITGFDPASGRGGPWNLIAGELGQLLHPDSVIVDRLFLDKLGVDGLGAVAEINNRRARIVGITSGIRTFTQSPYVFTTHAQAQNYTLFSPEQTTYLLIKLAPEAEREAVRQALAARLAPARGFGHARSSPARVSAIGCSPPAPARRCCSPPSSAWWWVSSSSAKRCSRSRWTGSRNTPPGGPSVRAAES